MSVIIRQMEVADLPGVVELQNSAFPPPFRDDYHWDPRHLRHHIEIFPAMQLVAEDDGRIVGSCSNARISERSWTKGTNWGDTVGGPMVRLFDPNGSTLYGMDIAVAPEHRRTGVGRQFYDRRFEYVRTNGLVRYGTGCRLPGYAAYAAENHGTTVQEYARRVVAGDVTDRTLTPLLRYGLTFLGVKEDYMDDVESGNAGALLEWRP